MTQAERACIECGEVGPHMRGCGQGPPHREDGPFLMGVEFDEEGRQRLKTSEYPHAPNVRVYPSQGATAAWRDEQRAAMSTDGEGRSGSREGRA